MSVRANDPRSKQRQIADDIRGLIADGVLTAGDRLPSTRELMARYSVSNQTVQGGLRYLTSEGLTHGVPGRGTFVRDDIDPAQLSHPLTADGGSPEYLALKAQIEVLADEVRDIRQQLTELASDRKSSRSDRKR